MKTTQQAPAQQLQPVVPATGYLAENWMPNPAQPAVIVNPNATPAVIASWCWGEVMSLIASVETLTMGNVPVEAGDISAIFQHRLRPLDGILAHLVEALMAQQQESAAGRAK